MASEASNGDNHVSSKPPPEPSPLRKAKFFQVSSGLLEILRQLISQFSRRTIWTSIL